MTVNKLSYPSKENATQQKINEIIDDYVDLSSNQNITGVKTFVGQKRIGFKQSGSSDKLGFTLYNNNNVEKGYLEFNPTNTIDGAPLMTLGNYATAAAGITHVGFRKYSSVSGANGAYNLLAPLISNAKTPFNLTTTYTNFYLPLGFTDGTTMVKAANTGVVDISSLLPDVSNFVTNSSLATTLTDYVTNSSLTTTLSNYQPLLVSGSNIKTVNNTSLLGSGNIDTSEIFIAEYGTTTFAEVLAAYNAGKIIFCYDDNNNTYAPITNYAVTDFYFSTGLINNISASYTLSDNDSWDGGTTTVNDPTITFTQGGITKGTITLNQSSNQTIALDAGGGGAVIDDTTPSTTTVYSSQKTQDLINALTARIMALEANINGGNA